MNDSRAGWPRNWGQVIGTIPRVLTLAERNHAVSRYGAGEPSTKIAADFGCSYMTVLNAVRQAGCQARTISEAKRTCDLDETSFDVWTEAAAYWAGFLAADGCVGTGYRSATVSLRLSEKDGEHVYRFRRFLRSTHQVAHRTTKSGFGVQRSVSIKLASAAICERLRSAGIQKRNRSRVIPALAGSPAFWRGVIDGDGCVGSVRRRGGVSRVEVLGGPALMSQFAEFVSAVAPGPTPTVHRLHARTVALARVVVSGTRAAAVLAVVYASGDPSLPRKREAAIRGVNFTRQRDAGRDR